MALIPIDELQQLKSASEVKTVASTAEADQQEQAIAYRINNAANCGQYETTYVGPIIDSVKTKLQSKGYTIKYDIARVNEEDIAHITWKE